MFTLSKRLSAALRFLHGSRYLADIGCDHGYLPIEAVKSGIIQKAIASDNKQGPLDKARINIREAGLETVIETMLADGISLLPSFVDTVAVLGMGGDQIAKILDAGDTSAIETLVLGPNSEAASVRRWLESHGFLITDEAFIKDHRHYYQIIQAKKGCMVLDPREAAFGPINIKRQDPLMLEYLAYEISKLSLGLQKASIAKRLELEDKINALKGVYR